MSKKLFFDIWQVTGDMWQVTRDMWHVTHDTWHMTCDMFRGVNILSKFQLPSSYRLWFMIIWRSGGKGWLTELLNYWMNHEAVYRTAPATPGLLKTLYCIRIRTRQGMRECPRAKPEGTPEGGGLYLTVYPESSPNTGSITFLRIIMLMIPTLFALTISPYTPKGVYCISVPYPKPGRAEKTE